MTGNRECSFPTLEVKNRLYWFIEFPALIDTLDNKTEYAYTAWPDRLYLIDISGKVAFKSEAGPFGFKTDLLSTALESISKP
jgi:hypothetical protein